MIKTNAKIKFIILYHFTSRSEIQYIAKVVLLDSTLEEGVLLDSRCGRFIPKGKVSVTHV